MYSDNCIGTVEKIFSRVPIHQEQIFTLVCPRYTNSEYNNEKQRKCIC